MDDLNDLLHREQMALLNARAADTAESRSSHEGIARVYATRIRDHRHPYRTPAEDGSAPFSLEPDATPPAP